jgi:hypothetical protein
MLFSRRTLRRTAATASAVAALLAAQACRSAVVVISNRTPQDLQLSASVDNGPLQRLAIAPGDSRPLFANSSAKLRSPELTGGSAQDIPLQPNCAYYVGLRPDNGQPALQKLGLGEGATVPWKPLAKPPLETADSGVISVKILVDDDEQRPRRVWEPLIRSRIDKASEVLDAHCGIRLRVVAIDTWHSDNRETDFERTLTEFESNVLPNPATVAIGFSSQYVIAKGRVHLGGTRGPLHSHILIKERSQNVLEPERLELLVHELGHFLGATHSPEPTSVMRPVIGQGLQRHAGAHNQFDPPNTLLMSLLAQEIRQRRVRDLADVSPETRARMQQIYQAINPTLPNDPAAEHYVRLMQTAGVQPLLEDTRRILAEIVRVADVRRKVETRQLAAGAKEKLTGDQLLEFYVRQAAIAAKQSRRENGPRAMLLALGIALDERGLLTKLPTASDILPHIEGQQQRAARLAAVGQPTMRGEAELAQQFFLAGNLVAMTGSQTARSPEMLKHIADASERPTLGFDSIAANRAGLIFAYAVLSRRLSLDELARRFTVEDVLPPLDELRDGATAPELEKDSAHQNAALFQAELNSLEARFTALPVYQKPLPTTR